jgi:hypothetical protein
MRKAGTLSDRQQAGKYVKQTDGRNIYCPGSSFAQIVSAYITGKHDDII